jgi:hypothetical protein
VTAAAAAVTAAVAAAVAAAAGAAALLPCLLQTPRHRVWPVLHPAGCGFALGWPCGPVKQQRCICMSRVLCKTTSLIQSDAVMLTGTSMSVCVPHLGYTLRLQCQYGTVHGKA